MPNKRIDIDVNAQRAKQEIREVADTASRANEQIKKSMSVEDVEKTIELIKKQAEQRAKQIQQEYGAAYQGNMNEYLGMQSKLSRGQISSDEFEKYKSGYLQNQTEISSEEREELSENQRETNKLIQELIDLQDEKIREEIKRRQNNDDEFSKDGILSALFKKRSAIMKARMDATTDDELTDYNKQLEKVNKLIAKKTGTKIFADKITEGAQMGEQIMGGNVGGAAMRGLSKLGPYGMAAAAVLALVGGGVMAGNERDKTIGTLMSYRALGTNKDINKSLYEGKFTRYGMSDADFVNYRNSLLRNSGLAGQAGITNTYDAIRIEKGYGIDNVAGLSTYARQDKYSKSVADNIMEMLNVLSDIRDGSISVDDLTRANEKAQLMYQLQGSFVGRQEKFDQRQVLGLMTAFEKMGGEGKDQRAGSFIEGTLNAIREGGSSNLMMLKYQFAAQAHPELANNPAALNRIVEEGTDSNYLVSTLKGLKSMAGGNKQNQYFLFKEYFKGLTPSMRQKLLSAAGDDEILQNMLGQGLRSTGTFNQGEADAYAWQKTQMTEKLLADLKNEVKNAGHWLKDQFSKPIDVRIRNNAANVRETQITGN